MDYRTFTVKEENADSVRTQVQYDVALAKADGDAFLRFDFLYESRRTMQKMRNAATKLLIAYRTLGKLSLVLPATEFGEGNTETAYLTNRYPALLADETLAGKDDFILVKI